MKEILNKIKDYINNADAIVLGAGSGLSTASGYIYSGKRFMDNFKYMYDLYGYKDMYSAGFHNFKTKEEYFGYYAKFVILNRYSDIGLDLYKKLYKIVENKNYFVITTNVDHLFQKSGFSKDRLFYTQGDYGLFQCSKPCLNITYDNEKQIRVMYNSLINNKIPSSLISRCPNYNRVMTFNLRSDDTFVENEGWHKAKDRYEKFINDNKNKKILFLELGVGYNTPVIIKYLFMRLTYMLDNARYVAINNSYDELPLEIKDKGIYLNANLEDVITKLS